MYVYKNKQSPAEENKIKNNSHNICIILKVVLHNGKQQSRTIDMWS